jgi:hypothetical protein
MRTTAVRRAALAAACSIVLAIALAACSGTPAATHQSSAPVVTPAPSALPAGTYTSTAFQPPVTFTLPAGWWIEVDSPAYLRLAPVDSEVLGVHLFRDAQAASQDPDCPAVPAPGVAADAESIATWIGERPGLVVSDPVTANVAGLRGPMLDLGIVDGWAASCPFADGLPTVPLLVNVEANYRWVVAGGERLRLYLLDLPDGGTVLVDIDDFVGDSIDALIEAATPIVESLSFAGIPVTP